MISTDITRFIDKKYIIGLFIIVAIIILFQLSGLLSHKKHEWPSDIEYLVTTTNCKIPDLEPFNCDVEPYYQKEEYTPCRKLDLLTYIERHADGVYLTINTTLLPQYSLTTLQCCYSTVTRGATDRDNTISISECTPFSDAVKIVGEVVKVTCVTFFGQEVYANVHAIVQPNPSLKHEHDVPMDDNHFNVLLVGIDTMSRMNLQRTMPKTFKYLENHWVGLKGYNKVDDNTFPNLMAILTGMNLSQVDDFYHPEENVLNFCDFIWDDYSKFGYVTAYGEDEAQLNTFNYLLKGFHETPTDLYFRPYFLAAETLPVVHKYMMSYCTGPETSGERMLHLIEDYLRNLAGRPKFGVFWMNSFSHNNINMAQSMDEVFVRFWRNLETKRLLNNTIVMFFSDHGFRFGKFVYTYSGWLEQRLPFNYFWIPRQFRTRYPEKYRNLLENSKGLSSPYDVYMTLQDILRMSNESFPVDPSLGCPKCQSLFEGIPENRTCRQAGVSQHWCTCQGHIDIDPNLPIVQDASYFALEQLQNQIRSYSSEAGMCSKYFLNRVITSGVTASGDMKYMLIIFETLPKAVFEVTVGIQNNSTTGFSIEGAINRVDRYAGKSDCVHDRILRTLCYCGGILTKVKSSLSVMFHN